MVVGFLGLLLAASLSAGSEEFDRAANVGAAEISVARVRKSLMTEVIRDSGLARAMVADPGAFSSRTEAEKACRGLYDAAVRAKLESDVRAVLAKLSGPGDPESAFGSDFVKKSVAADDELLAAVARGPFQTAFAAERATACTEQAKRLVAEVRPSVEVFDGGDETAIRRVMNERIAGRDGKSIFEENRGYVDEKIVTPMIESARAEKKRQAKYVREVRSDAFAPDVLARDLTQKIVAHVTGPRRKGEDPATAWGLFPSVTNRTVRQSVSSRTENRLAEAIAEVKFEPTAAEAEKAIQAGGAAHRLAAESERLWRTASGSRLLVSAIAAATAAAPDRERRDYEVALREKVNAERVSKKLDARLAEQAIPAWRAAREACVARTFAETWPKLADRTWFPDAITADDLASRSDFTDVVSNWRELPGTSSLDRGLGVFEESSARADASVRAAFEIARAAVTEQLQIVDRVHPSILAEARTRKESFFSRTPDLKAVIALLEEAVRKTWDETRLAVLWPRGDRPQNAAVQHVDLFPSVRRRIELVAKTIMEEMEKSEEKPKPEDEKPPEETPPDESETPPEEELCTITFEMNGGSVAVKATKGSRIVAEENAPATAFGFEEAVRKVGSIVGREILRLR